MRKIKHFLAGIILLALHNMSAQDIIGPAGSGSFGKVTVLPNGNFVVVDTGYDEGATLNVGAVYLYNGATKALISTIKGSTADDAIGSGGITVLTNGNYVFTSTSWDNGVATDAGAVTWGNGNTGVSGVVSSSNSLVGNIVSDTVGAFGVIALTNGNYIVRSTSWDNGGVSDAGAVTWGNGTTGITGTISSSNSLVGSTASDQIGSLAIALTNGNYILTSSLWDNGAVSNAGAVTWGNGTTGTSGVVSSSNSLVGSTANDEVGTSVTTLTNGNYVVRSTTWDNGAILNAGAFTWGNGGTGISGTISSSNSLIGSTDDDSGGSSVIALTNGNYVVRNSAWDNGAVMNAGAVTWGDGTTGVTGIISSSNSLVGSTSLDAIGTGVTALSNGNYVVRSLNWDNGAISDVGAVTWGDGTIGITGTISSSNSLVGSTSSDLIGTGVTALTNGNYVVRSINWDNGAINSAGAVTWGDGTTGTTGVVSSINSLVGSKLTDQVGSSITALTNGNYVVRSQTWDNGLTTNVGAVTWGDGTTGITGAISSSNSLIGSASSDTIGTTIIALTNGNYVVGSSNWDNGAVSNAGAVTWGDGTTGITGVITSSNSLVGSTTNDGVATVVALNNGNYVVRSTSWDNGTIADAGAVTWGNGTTGTTGVISSSISLVGSTASDGIGGEVVLLTNGNYVVRSTTWDNGAITNAGAVTWGDGTIGVTGIITSSNSLVGSTASDAGGIVTALTNGNYLVRSTNWDNGAIVDAKAATLGNGTTGISGVITACNSVLGEAANDLTNVIYNDVFDYLIAGKTVSNKINISNTLISTPSVSIVSSDADNRITSSTSVTFTAIASDGSTAPSYQWKVNGTNAGTNSATFTTTTLAHNDSVTVVVTNDPCASPTTATSNAIVTEVITTQIQAVFNGTTLTSITEPIYVDEVAGAEAYFYELTPTTGAVITKERAANEFAEDEFHFVHINYPQYNMAYTVKVKVRMGGVLGDFGPAVVITTPAAPTTKLQTAFCDVTIPALTTKLYADGVTSATGYRFEIVNGGTTRIYDTSLSFVDLTKVPGSAAYATTYTIRVAPLLNGVYTTYGTACNVTTPAPPAEVVTQLSASHTNLTVLNQKITAIAITGATSYRFEVTNQTTSQVQVYDSNTISSSFNLTQLTTQPTYATTYSIKVAYKTTGTYGSYGATRTVTTPALPSTKLRTLNCGTTLATLSSMIACNGIVGATEYTFEIVHNTITYEYAVAAISFKLRNVPTLPVTINSTYVIRVKAKVGGVYGSYGDACNVMTGASREGDIEEMTTSDFTVASFPNPFSNTFQLDLRSTSNNEVNVMVYDMIGKQIENRSFNALEVYNQTFGANYAAGVYNVLVSQNGTTKTVRVIKN